MTGMDMKNELPTPTEAVKEHASKFPNGRDAKRRARRLRSGDAAAPAIAALRLGLILTRPCQKSQVKLDFSIFYIISRVCRMGPDALIYTLMRV